MRSLKRALLISLVVVLVALVLFFVLENQQMVSLVLFGWAAPSMPVAVPVIGALVVGMAIGPFLAIFSIRRCKREARHSARQAPLNVDRKNPTGVPEASS